MLITRKSPLTGKETTLDLPVSQAQMDRYYAKRELVQNIFRGLTASQREFIMTGYTQEDWDTMFPPDED